MNAHGNFAVECKKATIPLWYELLHMGKEVMYM